MNLPLYNYVRYGSHFAQKKKSHKWFEANWNGLVPIVTNFKLEFLAPLQSSTFPLFFLPICMDLNRCQMFAQDSEPPRGRYGCSRWLLWSNSVCIVEIAMTYINFSVTKSSLLGYFVFLPFTSNYQICHEQPVHLTAMQ